MYRPPMWGDKCAWGLGTGTNQELAHSSRRIWDVTFSFLSKENTFPEYNALNKLADADETDDASQTLLTSDSFFSQVWNIVGTQHKFIWQPDKTVNEFAIAKFDQKNISFNQQSPSLWQIKCRIREVW